MKKVIICIGAALVIMITIISIGIGFSLLVDTLIDDPLLVAILLLSIAVSGIARVLYLLIYSRK